WERHYQRPLFEIVNRNGKPAQRGTRFLRLLDESLASIRTERLAVFPAVLEFLKVLDGTIIADELAPFSDRIATKDGTARSNPSPLRKLEKKFQLVGKGIKDYSAKRDVLDAVYDALLKEVQLRVVVRRGDEALTH